MPVEGKVGIRNFNIHFGGTLRPFANHLDVARHLQALAPQLPTDSTPRTLQNLVRLGILKPAALQREGFSLSTVLPTDLRRGITQKRLLMGLTSTVDSMPRQEGERTEVRLMIDSSAVVARGDIAGFGHVAQATASVSDTIWGIRQILSPVGVESDPTLTAGAKGISRSTKKGLAIAFLSATLPAISAHAITSGLGTTAAVAVSAVSAPALIGLLGVAGISVYLYAKSPAFRDTIHRSIFPVLTFAAMMGTRAYLASQGNGDLWQVEAYLGTMIGLHVIRGTISHFFIEKSRQKTLLKNDPVTLQNSVNRDLAREVLEQLQDVRRGRNGQTVENIISELDTRIADTAHKEHVKAAQDIKDIITANPAAPINSVLRDVNNYMIESISRVRDIKVPDQVMVGLARTSRIFNWFYLLVLTPAWGSGGFSTVNALIFGALYFSQLYYTVGAAWYSKLMENAEYVENTGLPKLAKDAKELPVICTVRYSNKGTLARKGHVPAYVQADILNRVLKGQNYYVVFNNDSNNHFWFEVAGTTRMAQHIEARMHYLLERVLPHIQEVAAMPQTERAKLAFALAVKEFDVDPMRMVDHAINAVYPNAPAGGAPMRFRDGHSWYQTRARKQSVGDGGGELACFRAIHCLVEDLHLSNQGEVLRELEALVVKENRLNLISLHEKAAVAGVCEELQRRLRLTDAQRDAIRDRIGSQVEYYLEDTLQLSAVNAGIDRCRAYAIAQGIVERTKVGLGFDAIAKTADRLILHRAVDDEAKQDFRRGVRDAFGLSNETSDEIMARLAEAPIDESARIINDEVVVRPSIFYRAWRYAQMALGWERFGVKSEEGNLRFLWRRLQDVPDAVRDPATGAINPTPQQEMKKFIVDCANAAGSPDPTAWIDSIGNLGESKVNVSAAMQIARAMQDQMINRGWLREKSRKTTEDISRHVAFELARRLAEIHPLAGDYARAAEKRGLSIEAADAEVWESFTEQIPAIAGQVVSDIAARSNEFTAIPREKLAEVAELAAEAAEEEFTSNKNEIFRSAVGFVELATRDLIGIREINRRFQTDTDFQARLAQRLDTAKASRLRATHVLSGAAITNPDIERLLTAVKDIVGAGVGNMSGKKGYFLTFVEILRDAPTVLRKDGTLQITAEGTGHEISFGKKLIQKSDLGSGTRTDAIWEILKQAKYIDSCGVLLPYAGRLEEDIEKDPALSGLNKSEKETAYRTFQKAQFLGKHLADKLKKRFPGSQAVAAEDVIRLLVHAQIEENIAASETELWVSSRTGLYREGHGYERVVQEAASVPIAAEIIKQLAAAAPATRTATTVNLIGKEVDIVNACIGANTASGIKPESPVSPGLVAERKELLRNLLIESDRGHISLDGTTPLERDFVVAPDVEADAVTIRNSFDSVYRFSRVWGFRWLKGKDVNTNREFLGSSVYEQIGTMARYLIGLHFEERRGFYYGSTILAQRLKVEVSQLLQLSTDETENRRRHLQLGIMDQDLLRRLMARISTGDSPEAAAVAVWNDIYSQCTANERTIVGAWNRTGTKSVMDQIQKNLVDIAQDVAVEYHAAEAMRILHAPLATPDARPDKAHADAYAKTIPTSAVRKKVKAMIDIEMGRLSKNAGLIAEYQSALENNNTALALEIEQKISYKGDVRTWAAQYRHGDPHPELIVGNRHRSFSELAAWISSSQHAAERSVEKGDLVEDCIMLRKIAAIADDTMREIIGGNRNAVLAGLGALPARIQTQAEILVDGLIADADMTYRGKGPRLFNSFDEAEGLRLKERKYRFEKLLGIILEAREKETSAAAEEEKAQALREIQQPKLIRDTMVNCLDEARYPKTAMEQVRAQIQMNADTDNYFYPEILDAASHFGNLWGVLSNPNDVLQYGLNYSIPSRSPFVRFQRDRDLGGPQNANGIRTAGSAFGIVRHRWDRREFASTLTGYANLFPLGVAFRTTEYVLEPNVSTSSYHGQRALEIFLGKDWWKIDGKTKWADLKKFGDIGKRWENYREIRRNSRTGTEAVQRTFALFINNLGRFHGHADGWDLFMALSHWPPLVALLSGSVWLMGRVVNAGLGHLTGADMDFDVSESLGVSLEKLFMYSAGAWAICKGLSHTMGRTLVMNNYYRGRRVYVLHPSEDLATTYTLMSKGIYLTALKGLRQQNDAMSDYDGDMGQKLRWQASNAALFRPALKTMWKYRKILTAKQSFDLLQGPMYNIFGVPGMFNRLAILGFVYFGEPSILMPNEKVFDFPMQDSLGWLIETGLINYALVEAVGSYSRIKGGSSWKGVHSNLAYEATMVRYNYNFVMRRLWHGENAGFNVTDPPEQVPQVKTHGKQTLSQIFMGKNWFYLGLQAYAFARILGTHTVDSIKYMDFKEMGMISLLFWVGYPTYLMIKGLCLNTGISPVADERKWEDKKKIWKSRT